MSENKYIKDQLVVHKIHGSGIIKVCNKSKDWPYWVLFENGYGDLMKPNELSPMCKTTSAASRL